MSIPSMSSDREDRLDAIIADYLQRCDDGEAVPADQWLDAHPEFREELRTFLLDNNQMQGLAAPLAVPIMSGRPVSSKLRYFGDYELLEEIARGGMGIVYRARQTSLNRIVAVKMILAGRLATEDDERRFQIEAEAAASLRHPHIVTVHEVGRHDGQNYFSMQFIEGKNLSQLTQDAALPIERAVDYVAQVAEAVHYAHEQGTLHRDLKPSNVLIDENDDVQITDFGLAMKVEGGSDLTQTGQTLGTPGYMSPEQARGKRDSIGPTSDVYSCGTILYELLTGRPPFRGDSAVETLRLLLETEPISPRLLNPSVPRDLETICLKCLEKEPAKRYRSAAELAADLKRFRNGEPIHARPIGRLARAWRWCRRKPAIAALSAGLAVAVLATVVGLSAAVRRIRIALTRVQDQKQISDDALAAERKALVERTQAVSERDRALKRLEWQTYMRGILVARHEQQAGNLVGAERILDECGPAELRSVEWHFLKALCRRNDAASRHGHISSIALTRDGYSVVYADGAFRIFETATGRQIARTADAPYARTAALSADGRRFAAQVRAKAPGTSAVQIYSLPDGKPIRVLSIPTRIQRQGITFSADGARLAVLHHEPRSGMAKRRRSFNPARLGIWNVSDGTLARSSKSDEYRNVFRGTHARAIGLSGDLRFAVTQTCLLDTKDGRVLRRFSEPAGCCAFDARGRLAGIADAAGMIEVLELPSGKPRLRWQAGNTLLSAMAFRRDGTQLAAGDRKGKLVVWEPASGRRLYALQAGSDLDQIGFLPEHPQLVTAHRTTRGSGSIKVWPARRPDVLVIPGAPRAVSIGGHTPAISPRTGDIAAFTADNAVAVRESVTGRVLQRFPETTRRHFVTYNPDGSRIAVVGSDGFHIWNAQTGRLVRVLKPAGAQFSFSCCFSPDGRLLAGAHQNGVTVWKLEDGQETKRFSSGTRYYYNIGFSRDGRLLFVTGDGGDGRILNVKDWSERCRLERAELNARHAAIDPEGRVLATATLFRGIDFYETTTGKRTRSILIPGGCRSVAFSSDGKRILVACGNEVQLRDRASGDLLLTLSGHRSGVSRAAFSPDGRRIISTSSDGTVRVWGVNTVSAR